jgi:hypothetical protein
LIDPLVAMLIGVLVLGEPAPVTAVRTTIGVLGLAATSAGIWFLAHHPQPAPIR